MLQKNQHFAVRTAKKSDLPFVANCLQRNLRRSCRTTISDLVAEKLDSTWIVCIPSEPDVALGFLMAEPAKSLIYYVYIKSAFRDLGLARALVEHAFEGKNPTRYALQHGAHNAVKPLIARFKLDYEPIAAMIRGDK